MLDKTRCLDKLKTAAIGLEAQRRYIESVLFDFNKTSKGGSCVLSGRRGTGKSLVLDLLLEEHFNDDEIIHEDGDFYTNANQPLRKLCAFGLVDDDSNIKSKDEDLKTCRLVIIIDHFEYFTSKKSQNFLYTLLNGTHKFPWFVFLVGSTQDCASVPPLEKRVYSRLEKFVISFNTNFSEEQKFEAFYTFLSCFADCPDIADVLKMERKNWERPLRNFFVRSRGMCELKRLAALFALIYKKGENGRVNLFEGPVDLLEFCAKSICPEDDMMPILRAMPLRQLCLLYCFVNLQRSEHKFEFLCGSIILEYKRFLHTHGMVALQFTVDDSVLYKDIEELICVGAVNFRGSSDIGELQFRKVSLNPQERTLMSAFKERNLPAELAQWIHLN